STMNTGMRTLGLTQLRISATAVFEQTSTAVVASPMPRPLVAVPVTASSGHRASIWVNTMFCDHRPSLKMLRIEGPRGRSGTGVSGGADVTVSWAVLIGRLHRGQRSGKQE